MRQSNFIKDTFNQYAWDYEDKFNRNPLGIYQRDRVHLEITPYLKTARTILDMGCGPGSDFEFYKSLKLNVDAIDVSPQMVDLALKRAEKLKLNVNIYESSLENYQTNNRYDAVILNFGVINVFEDLPSVLLKLKSLLMPDGILIVVSMPPLHFFSLGGLIIKLKFRSAAQRLFQQKAILSTGFKFFYYREKNFTGHFNLIKRIHLCPLLPTPDQYHKSRIARTATKLLLKMDRKAAAIVPDLFGGDHVCYILSRVSL